MAGVHGIIICGMGITATSALLERLLCDPRYTSHQSLGSREHGVLEDSLPPVRSGKAAGSWRTRAEKLWEGVRQPTPFSPLSRAV